MAMSDGPFPFDEGDLVRINLNTGRKGILDAVCIGFVDLAADSRGAVFEIPMLNPDWITLEPHQADFTVLETDAV
jgi:hypothetical protein